MKKNIFLFAALISNFCLTNPQLFCMESDTEPDNTNYILEYNGVAITNNSFCDLLVFNHNENGTSDLDPRLLSSGATIQIKFTHHYSILPNTCWQ